MMRAWLLGHASGVGSMLSEDLLGKVCSAEQIWTYVTIIVGRTPFRR